MAKKKHRYPRLAGDTHHRDTMRGPETNAYIRGIKRVLWLGFKAHCARRGVAIRDRLEELIRDACKEDLPG